MLLPICFLLVPICMENLFPALHFQSVCVTGFEVFPLYTELQHHSLNQDKLEVVKQEMARVNVDILGISELKWTGMGEFNSDDHYIYYCGQETLRGNGVAIMVSLAQPGALGP